MSDVTQEQKTMAMIAHLLGIVSWFVGPLIIWLINKDKADQEFVIDQSKEALNFQITMAIHLRSSALWLSSLGLASALPD